MINLIQTNPLTELELALRIGLAIVVGGIIGLEREYKNRPAGIRTHVLVCLGASIVALLETLLWESGMLANTMSDNNISITVGRLSAQVISGIGFLGAGTIFMAQKKVSGLTTAASLWNVACLGVLMGFGYYELGVIVGVLITLVLRFMGEIISVNAVKHVEIKFTMRMQTLEDITEYFHKHGIIVLDVNFHVEQFKGTDSPESNMYTNLYTLQLPRKLPYSELVADLSEHEHILAVRTRDV